MGKNRRVLIMTLLLLSVVALTVGISYAVFNYAKEGTTDNMITTQSIEFLYTEVDKVGAGIAIEDAYPISDTQGKNQTGAGKVFNFKVTSRITDEINIPYTVTARKKSVDNSLDDEAVRIYLTEVEGTSETQVLLDNYNNLTDYENRPTGTIEKIIYEGLVSAGTKNYEKNFRLRMWIDSDVKFSPIENEDGSITYPYNDKEFTLNVNVYANAKVVTDAEVDMANTTKIENIIVNDPEVQAEVASGEEEYDYIANVDNGVSNVSLEIETTNPEATVEVTRLDNATAYRNNVRRLSQTVAFDLEEGDNLFNIKIISANKRVENEYILNIFRAYSCAYDIGHKWTFDYSGNSEEFIVPCGGTYKLEVYGAQGGPLSTLEWGGKGGYSYGNTNLNSDDRLYVAVGGKGSASSGTAGVNSPGGYNGGGAGCKTNMTGYDINGAGGGGATHIAIGSINRGELKNYVDYKNEILIVAGGGAGAFYNGRVQGADGNYYGTTYNGGSGGGLNGGTIEGTQSGLQSVGGSQTEAGAGGSFGKGADSAEYYGSGAGGGWYGGGIAAYSTSAGGSGYIDGVTDGSTENGVREGNGYAQITLISLN